MRPQLILTLLWLFFLVLAMGILESYVHFLTPEGKRYLLPDDRNELLLPITTMYGGYLTGILAFWFLKPFSPPQSASGERLRFLIALLCTLILNLSIIGLLVESYFSAPGERDVAADMAIAVKLMKWLSFIVAPVNLFYFGSRS